ncbi:MAG: MFS transporter [Opitutaceae bacterium]|nr:MFS transporter [Opitutaceae bacterium]
MPKSSHAQTPAKERAILLMLTAVQFTHFLDYMIIMPLGSRLMRVFSISPGQFSHLVAAYGLAAALTGFAGGFVLDRFDRKHALLVLYIGFGIATLACALAPNYGALLLARCAAGAFGGVSSSLVTAMVGDVVPAARRGRAMGIVLAAFPMASVLGVPLGLLLSDKFEWHAPFFLLAGLSVLVLALGARVLPRMHALHVPAHPWKQMIAILSHPIHQRAFMLCAALVFAGGSVIPFLAPSMVANVGLSEAQLPLIYLAGGIGAFITTPIIGRLSDRHDKFYLLGWLSLAASTVVLALTNLPHAPVGVAMLVTCLFMVSMSGRFTPAMAMVANAVESRYRGGFMSVNSAVQQAAAGLANLTAGLLVTRDVVSGRLLGYPRAGCVTIFCFGLTVYFAARLRAAAPYAARSGHPSDPPTPVLD